MIVCSVFEAEGDVSVVHVVGPIFGIDFVNGVSSCGDGFSEGRSSEEFGVEGIGELGGGIIADGPVGPDVVGDATAEECFRETDVSENAFDATLRGVFVSVSGSGSPDSTSFAGIEDHPGGELTDAGEICSGEDAVVAADEPATGAVDGIKEGVSGVVHDVIFSGTHFGQETAVLGFLLSDLGNSDFGVSAELRDDSITFVDGPREVAGGVDDEEHL